MNMSIGYKTFESQFLVPQELSAAREVVAVIRARGLQGISYPSRGIYETYLKWAAKRDLTPVHINTWGRALREVGMVPVAKGKKRYWMLP